MSFETSEQSERERRPSLLADLSSHPRGLAILSATELAERFSYYGMTSLLVLYMVNQLLLPAHAANVMGLAALRSAFSWRGSISDQAFASLVYGWYAGLVYFTPLFGGWLADRFLGARRTVTLGALLMAAGHVAMSFDATFLIALLLLILGSGCLKGNISAQVAPLYPAADESRRARGFTIFSTGINVGATAGPLATGALAQAYGWHAGFGCAAALMFAALAIYLSGQKHLRGKSDLESEASPIGEDVNERERLIAIILLILVNVPIAMAYYQVSNVGLVWIDKAVDLATPLGRVPAAWFSSVDSFSSIIVAGPLLSLWAWQSSRGREPNGVGKVLIGAIINTVAPLILATGIFLSGTGAVSVIWPLLGWFLFGLAFMYYWPLTLGLIAARAPVRFRSTLMGGAFLALFAGNVLLGWVGSFYESMSAMQFWLLDAAIAASAVLVIFATRARMERALVMPPPGV